MSSKLSKSFLSAFVMTLITGSQAFSQSANSSAQGEQATDIVMGGASIAIGGAMMHTSCPANHMMCALGAAGAAAGVANIATGFGRSSTIAATDPLGGDGSTGGTTTDPGASGFSTAGLPQPVADAFNSAQQIAQQNGMDLTNPASIDAYKAKNGVSGGGGGGGNLPSTPMPPDVLAAVQKAKADFLSKFNVSSVAFENSGGGAGHSRTANDDGDMKAFLDALNGNKDGRDPASVAGLQKTLGNDVIGVAADDIFKQVSRRYQAKIAAKSFLAPVPLK